MTVENSTLTGHGGYYGAFGNGSLTVSNSTISAPIIGYGTGKVRLDNCSDATSTPVQILAAQGSTIVSVNTALGANVTYGATDRGRVDVEATLTLATTVDQNPQADVAGFVGPTSGPSHSPLGATGVNGRLRDPAALTSRYGRTARSGSAATTSPPSGAPTSRRRR